MTDDNGSEWHLLARLAYLIQHLIFHQLKGSLKINKRVIFIYFRRAQGPFNDAIFFRPTRWLWTTMPGSRVLWLASYSDSTDLYRFINRGFERTASRD
jgi:hypothetical protein